MIRFFDITLSLIGLILLLPILVIIYFVGLFDTGSPLFRQVRVGKNLKPFTLIKFRTMSKNTSSVASHLANPSSITKTGKILRKTKLDELPQLWNVLVGDMSIVGPRPNLFNQDELIKERTLLNVYSVLPGITGKAQINNIDMSDPKLLAQTDAEMISQLTLKTYLFYIVATAIGKGTGDVVKWY